MAAYSEVITEVVLIRDIRRRIIPLSVTEIMKIREYLGNIQAETIPEEPFVSRINMVNVITTAKGTQFTGRSTTNEGAIEAVIDKTAVPAQVYPNLTHKEDDSTEPSLAVKIVQAEGRKVAKNTLNRMGIGIESTSTTKYVTPLVVTRPNYQ